MIEEKGYVIAIADGSDFYLPGAHHIERNDNLIPWVFHNDEEAARGAERDGVKLIYGMAGVDDGIYIDTPENRQIIKDAVKERMAAQTAPEPDFPISIYLSGDIDGQWHGFPTTTEDLQATLKVIGVDSSKIDAQYYATDISYLGNRLPDTLTLDNLDELNYLAVKLEEMPAETREDFASVMQSERHCDSLKDIINVTENLLCFDFQPAYSAEQYGEFLAEMEKDEFTGTIEKLRKSNDPDLRDLVGYIEKLETHVDIASYGRARAAEENGVFTEHGYLTEGGDFKEVYKGPEDIPAEHRVFVMPVKEPLMKVENADLTDLLLKMHALGGDFMPDAQNNVCMLANSTAHHLMLVNERNIFLTGMRSAYYRDTTAFDVCMNAVPDTKAFALDAVYIKNGRVFGSLTGIDFMERQNDIQEHSFWFTHIDAKLKDGSERRYTLEAWDSMELIDRDRLGSWSPRFYKDDINALVSHLDEEVRKLREMPVKIVSPDDFLAHLNHSYMERAENPQPDMLRVTLSAARDMLARGDAEVYRLLPDGPKKLTPMDAVKGAAGFWYSEYREFAIKREDMAGLDKWAARGAGDILRRSLERDAPDKPKSRGLEL